MPGRRSWISIGRFCGVDNGQRVAYSWAMKSKIVKVVLAESDCALLDAASKALSDNVNFSRSACIRRAIRGFYDPPERSARDAARALDFAIDRPAP